MMRIGLNIKNILLRYVMVAVLAVSAVFPAGFVSAVQSETLAPSGGTIGIPTNGTLMVLPITLISISGLAKDQSNVPGVAPTVQKVTVALKNLDTGEWLQENGTWKGGPGSRFADDAEIMTRQLSGGTMQASWRLHTPSPGVGYFLIEATAFDESGNKESPAVKSFFTVVAPGSGDTQRPTNSKISTPLHSTTSTYTINTQTDLVAEGIATDRSNDPVTPASIQKVFIAVKDRSAAAGSQWLQNTTGTPVFGSTRKVFEANLGAQYPSTVGGLPGVARPWTFQVPRLAAGNYSLEAQGADSSAVKEGTSNCRAGETCVAYPFSWFRVTSGTTGDLTPPSGGTITFPTPTSAITPNTALTITGIARDTSNDPLVAPTISTVKVAILRKATNQWLQNFATNTWGSGRTTTNATLIGSTVVNAGVATRSWSVSLPAGLSTGEYRIEVQSWDAASNKETPAVKQDVLSGTLDTIRPAWSTITQPTPYTSYSNGTAPVFAGVARDTSNGSGSSPTVSNIPRVKITLRDVDNDNYLQTDGSFAAQRIVFDATLGSFTYNSSTQTWAQSWSWSPTTTLPSGEYVLSAIAEDIAGNTEAADETIGYAGSPTVRVAVGSVSDTGYLTLSFGRAQMQQYADLACTSAVTSATGSLLTLSEVAQRLNVHSRPLAAVGNVTPNRTTESLPRTCISGIAYPTWSDLASLRDTYGWKFVSTGQAYTPLDTTTFPYVDPDPEPDVTVASLDAEICGSLSAFTAHGHNFAKGLFAFPNNKFPPGTVNASSDCFSFGRDYQYGFNVKSKVAAPWLAKVSSIDGGLCNDAAAACYTTAGVPGSTENTARYVDPAQVGRLMTSQNGLWSVVQLYRFVTGSKTSGPGPNWDCTNADWKRHYTSLTELYCWVDYETALNQIPASVVVTDPLTVANAWGRIVP